MPLHSPKYTVWAATSARGIFAPIFIEKSDAAVTDNKERYVEVLTTFKSEIQTLYPSLMSKFWFQQDWASPHTSNLFRDWLKENFRSRVISLKTDFEWAPHSPDLSPQIFSFGGYLKNSKLHRIKPTIEAWPNLPNRKESVILTRLRIGHTRISHDYLMTRGRSPVCCGSELTVEHMITKCKKYEDLRKKNKLAWRFDSVVGPRMP